MPTIDFYCNNCESIFEELILKRDELREVKCPKCNSKNLERLFSTFGVRSSDYSNNIGSSCTSCDKNSCTGCSK